jgi:hypothetical protein
VAKNAVACTAEVTESYTAGGTGANVFETSIRWKQRPVSDFKTAGFREIPKETSPGSRRFDWTIMQQVD